MIGYCLVLPVLAFLAPLADIAGLATHQSRWTDRSHSKRVGRTTHVFNAEYDFQVAATIVAIFGDVVTPICLLADRAGMADVVAVTHSAAEVCLMGRTRYVIDGR